MPWIVVSNRVGQPIEATPCVKDCFDRLEGLARLRRSKGDKVVKVSARIYEATSPSGEVEYVSVDDGEPDFPPGRPPVRR